MKRYDTRVVLTILALTSAVGCERANEPSFRVAPLATRAEEPSEPGAPLPPPPDSDTIPSLVQVDPRARPLILDPADLTTATYETHPTIGVPRRGLSEREVAALAAGFELVTWPERERVETTPVYLDEAVEPAAYSRIVLEPAEPLTDRWYALRARVDAADAPDPLVSPRDGEFSVSRFRIREGARADLSCLLAS